MQREKFAQEQKDLALKRAAELVASNRVPIEITRGAAAAKAAANAALAAGGHQPTPEPVAPAHQETSVSHCSVYGRRFASDCDPLQELVGQIQCNRQGAQPKG